MGSQRISNYSGNSNNTHTPWKSGFASGAVQVQLKWQGSSFLKALQSQVAGKQGQTACDRCEVEKRGKGWQLAWGGYVSGHQQACGCYTGGFRITRCMCGSLGAFGHV